MKIFGVFLVLSILSSSLIAQSTDNEPSKVDKPVYFLRLDGEYGVVFNNGGLPSHNNWVNSYSIEAGIQTTGGKIYNELMSYPAVGFGLLSSGFPQSSIMGQPNAFYLFLNQPLKRWAHFAFNSIFRLGMGYNWKPSDPAATTINLAIGSYRNIYVAVGFEGQYLFAERYSLSLGLKFGHFSNGSTSHPNKGLNMVTPHIGMRYDFNNGKRPSYSKTLKPDYRGKSLQYSVILGYGVRQIVFERRPNGVPSLAVSYPVYNLSFMAQYQFGWFSKVGGGLTGIYWGAYDPQYEIGPGGIIQGYKHPVYDCLQLGIFISYELVLNQFSFYIQPGWRIVRKAYEGMPPDFYQQLGLKYHIKNVIVGMSIRAINFGQANYMEWNLGYRFKKSSKK